jgi:DNA-3-methyladenine glycosylase
VLVRAGQPVAGLPNMLARRQMRQLHPRLTSGPGALSGALGIQVATHNGLAIGSNSIRIFDPGTYVPPPEVRVGTRVGVGYAGTDALRPYRFRVANCPFVSKAKGVGE